MTQKIACVLGMHRSGTSALTRILSALGAYLGPESMLVPAAHDNPTGFWELQPIVDINQSILTRFGGRAMDPPGLPDGWEDSETVADLRARAAELIENEFSAQDFWAWKDPRACLTLPFWQAIIPGMRYVVCVRRPEEVAASLKQRNNIPSARSVYLWLLYNRAAWVHSGGAPRHFITYDEVMKEPVRQAEMLADFLGERVPVTVPDVIASFIDPARRHHAHSEHDERDNSSSAQKSLALRAANDAYAMMSQGGHIKSSQLAATFDRGLGAIVRRDASGQMSYKS